MLRAGGWASDRCLDDQTAGRRNLMAVKASGVGSGPVAVPYAGLGGVPDSLFSWF